MEAQPTANVGARTRSVQASAGTALEVRSGRGWGSPGTPACERGKRSGGGCGSGGAEPEPVDAGAARNPVVPEWSAAQAERNGGRSVVERRSGLPFSFGIGSFTAIIGRRIFNTRARVEETKAWKADT